MKIYSHHDPNAKPIFQKLSKYTQQAEALGMPYWVFAQDTTPIGLVAVGKEPVQLLASPGTPMAMIQLVDTEQPKENAEDFARKALELATEKEIEYALSVFSSEETEAINQFKELDFKDFDDSYKMVCQLNKPFILSEELQFQHVQREEMRQFIKIAEKFLEGSPDVSLRKALEHFPELPDDFLDFYYSQEEFYFVNRDHETVGVLDFNISRGLISNVGVDPQKRGRGYGRQIMLFALQQLKKNSCEQAYLRVHVDNEPAIHLYESLGFKKAERYKTLMWKRTE